MPIADRGRHPLQRVAVIAALLATLGIVGFLVLGSGSRAPDSAKQSTAEPASASDTPRPMAASSAPTNAASRVLLARPASSNAPGPVPPWHASLQPAVVAATRVESLAAYQVQMERWTCDAEQCIGNFRVPPTVGASRNMSTAADIFDSLKKKMAQDDIEVSLSSIHPGPQGLAMSLQFTPNASAHGRFYSDAEITAIRMESFEQGHKASEQERNPHAQDPGH